MARQTNMNSERYQLMIKINIAKDFSSKPFGRYKSDGQWSAERFRQENLLPAFSSSNENIEVYLNDVVRGFGSSFLEESFGGLIRENVDYEDIKSRLVIKTTDADYEEKIWEYIEGRKRKLLEFFDRNPTIISFVTLSVNVTLPIQPHCQKHRRTQRAILPIVQQTAVTMPCRI
jgi:hypothetical protein